VGFGPTISVSERARTVRALDHAATAIGKLNQMFFFILISMGEGGRERVFFPILISMGETERERGVFPILISMGRERVFSHSHIDGRERERFFPFSYR
jgi:hypothetical protein